MKGGSTAHPPRPWKLYQAHVGSFAPCFIWRWRSRSSATAQVISFAAAVVLLQQTLHKMCQWAARRTHSEEIEIKRNVMLSWSKHFHHSSNPFKWISQVVEMLRPAQHNRLFAVRLLLRQNLPSQTCAHNDQSIPGLGTPLPGATAVSVSSRRLPAPRCP